MKILEPEDKPKGLNYSVVSSKSKSSKSKSSKPNKVVYLSHNSERQVTGDAVLKSCLSLYPTTNLEFRSNETKIKNCKIGYLLLSSRCTPNYTKTLIISMLITLKH